MQRRLTGTYIPRFIVVLAAMVYKWIVENPIQSRTENCRDNSRLKGSKKPLQNPGFLRFVAYFPSYIMFHETNHLGVFGNPFDFVQAKYEEDISANITGTGCPSLFTLPDHLS